MGSKTLFRTVPGDPLVGPTALAEALKGRTDRDLEVVTNERVCGDQMDILLGGIYGINGYEANLRQ